MKKALAILIPVAVCFLIGFTASYFQEDAISNWYPYLNKPAITPPNVAFPIAWSIIYVLMGVSIGLIIISDIIYKKPIIILFVVQLLLNFTWSISFFYLQNPLLGLINILLLDIAVAYYIMRTYQKVKLSSILFMPYLLWILFATYLNLYILINN